MFKEEARRIISADRAANRSGRSQNTIGEIERAMVRAYKQGQEASSQPAKGSGSSDEVDWILIPPRSRDVLWYMTLSFSSFRSTPNFVPDRLICVDEEPKTRWYSISQSDRSGMERGFLDGPVQKLVQMKLLAPSHTDPNILELTELGKGSCKSYWKRSDANDPSLPVMSVRG
jgi:hypothetical protein